MLPRKFKSVLKVLLILAGLFVILIATIVYYRGAIIRYMAIERIKSQIGLGTRLDAVHVGLGQPKVRVEHFAITNSSEFGSSILLHVPELYIEIDPDAFAKQELRIKKARFSLAELNIVRNKQGKTNIIELAKTMEDEIGKAGRENSSTNIGGYDFKGVDELVLSIGAVRYIDLGDPKNSQTFNFGVTNHISRNVKTEEEFQASLATVILKASLRNLLFAPANTNENRGGASPLDFLLNRRPSR